MNSRAGVTRFRGSVDTGKGRCRCRTISACVRHRRLHSAASLAGNSASRVSCAVLELQAAGDRASPAKRFSAAVLLFWKAVLSASNADLMTITLTA